MLHSWVNSMVTVMIMVMVAVSAKHHIVSGSLQLFLADDSHTEQSSQRAQQRAMLPLEFCSILLAMMTWSHLDSDLCQHVITLINRALDAPDGPHKGFPSCLALRQRLVMALLDKGLMRVITDLQDLVQESLFHVSHCYFIVCSLVYWPWLAPMTMQNRVNE